MPRFIIAALLVVIGAPSYAVEIVVDGKKVEVPVCGGFAGITCRANQWCDFPDDSACGVADYFGTCRPRPELCPDVYIPVCGCDGKDYGNSCEAHRGGTDVAYAGHCLARK
jgi:hypothetical protein